MQHRLIYGEAIEEMRKLIAEGIKVDAIITDPPFGSIACKWDSVIPFEDMWLCLNALKTKSAPVLLFGSEPFSSALRMSNIKNYKYDWIWEKNTGTNFLHSKRQPIRYTENIHVFMNGACWYNPQKTTGHVPTNSGIGSNTGNVYSGKSIVNYKGGDTTRYPKNILSFNKVNNYSRIHPSQKPVELLEYLIKTHTNEGDTVLDFTCGSGSAGVACQKLNRNFIGIDNGVCDKEKSEFYNWKWVDITKYRIENEEN